MLQRGQVKKFDIDEKIVEVINHCLDKLVKVRGLDVSDVSNFNDGLTNFITVDRAKLIKTELEELIA